MLKQLVTKNPITWARGFSCTGSVEIPAGSPVQKYRDEWWIDPKLFEGQKLLQHDAVHYGCRVDADNIAEQA